MLTAIRRASSRVSRFIACRRPKPEQAIITGLRDERHIEARSAEG
jgi:hypothetical protein